MSTHMFNIDDEVSQPVKSIFLAHAKANWEKKKHFNLQTKGGSRGYYDIQNFYNSKAIEACNIEVDKVYEKLKVNKADYLHCRHFLGYNAPGAWVTDHTDQIQFVSILPNAAINLQNYVEIRLNFYLQRPEGGGQPGIINNGVRTLIENIPNKGWIFNASIPHFSTPVEGNKDRIVISFGSILLKKTAFELGLMS